MKGIHLLLASGGVLFSVTLGAGQQAIPIDLQHVREFPENESVPEAALTRVTDLEVGPDGMAYVLDFLQPHVMVFDSMGVFQFAMGRRGGGPGEFSHPSDIVLRDSLLFVVDPDQQRVTAFLLDGKVVETWKIPTLGGSPPMRMTPLQSGSYLVQTASLLKQSERDRPPLVHLIHVGPHLVRSDTLATFTLGTMRVRDHATDRVNFSPVNFGPEVVYAVENDTLLVIADGYSGDIRRFRVDGDSLLLEAQRTLPLTGKPISSRELHERIRDEFLPRRPGDRRRNEFDFFPPPMSSGIIKVLLDDQGRAWLWKNPWVVGGPGQVILLDHRLNEIGEFTFPPGLEVLLVKEDRLYGVRRNALDVPTIHVFDMRVSR